MSVRNRLSLSFIETLHRDGFRLLFILPYLQGQYFIETKLLSELEEIPEDLENYVLKPLFSFSGRRRIFIIIFAR